ncbi:MAG: hypothetical protein QOC65_536 [Sphingomonadales bacterium]|nr:hypothetical protein [Sphingomonadales bacterium]
MLPVPVFYGLLALVCLYALALGGAPERIGAGIFLAGAILSTASISSGSARFISVELGVVAVDLVMLAALLALALRAERFWPIWVTALHIVGTAGHAVKAVDPAVMRLGYAIAMALSSYPMLLILVGATWCHRRRLARDGTDRPWSASSARSALRPRPGPTG